MALDKHTGELVWTHDTGGKSFHADPVFVDSLVILPSDDRRSIGSVGPVFGLNRITGAVAWQHDVSRYSELGCGVTTDLKLIDDCVIGTTTQDEVLCLEVGTGETRWSFRSAYDTTNNYWSSVPAVDDSAVYVGGLDGVFRALSLRDGSVLWQTELGARVSTSTVLHNGSIYCGAADNMLYRLNRDGEIVNQVDVKSLPAYQLNATDEAVFAFTADTSGYSGMLHLLSFDPSLDSVRWDAPASEGTLWSIKRPYLWKGYVLAGDGDGFVHIFEQSSGDRVARFHVDGEVRSLGFDGDMIFVGTIRGMVYGVRTRL